MRTLSVLALLTISSIALFSCKKSNSDLPPNQWTINSVTYKGVPSRFDYGGADLWTADTTGGYTWGNSVTIYLSDSFSLRPFSGSFTVVSPLVFLKGNQCALNVFVNGQEVSSLTGGALHTSVSGTKISASFSNISVSVDGTTTFGTISGNLSTN